MSVCDESQCLFVGSAERYEGHCHVYKRKEEKVGEHTEDSRMAGHGR